MAVYQKKFVLNGRSNTDFGLIVCAITPDDGETDSYLTMESIYTESFDVVGDAIMVLSTLRLLFYISLCLKIITQILPEKNYARHWIG